MKQSNAQKNKRRFVEIDELTEDQIADILHTFTDHKIQVSKKKTEVLLYEVFNLLDGFSYWLVYDSDEMRKKRNARANVIKKIRKLQDALTTLPEPAISILNEAESSTEANKWLKKIGIDADIFYEMPSTPASRLYRTYGPLKFVLTTLIEACDVALQPTPPIVDNSLKASKNILDHYTNKNGRPKNTSERVLCLCLADEFKNATGIEPTDCEGGVFDNFLSACLRVIEPDRDAQEWKSNRKLIRASLEKTPQK